MVYQGQILTFTIPSSGSYSGAQTAYFSGNIANNEAWVAIQSIDISYSTGKHYRGINQFVPTVTNVNGNAVTVDLKFLYANNNQNDIMSGTVKVLVNAENSALKQPN